MKKRQLTPKQEGFAQAITDSDNKKTFRRKKASAEAAGYAESCAANMGTKLWRDPLVRARIDEINAQNAKSNAERSESKRNELLSILEYAIKRAIEKDKEGKIIEAVKVYAAIEGFLRESGLPAEKSVPRKLSKEEQEIYSEAARKLNLLGLIRNRKEEIEEEVDEPLEVAV